MTIYTVFSWIFIVLVLGFTAFWILWFAIIRFKNNKADRANNIAKFRTEIRNYKFGKFLWVYVLSFPLFVMSFTYSGASGWECVFKSLTNAFKLMALQFDFDLLLAKINSVYAAAIHITYLVAVLNMAMFIMSCLNQIFWSFIAWARFNHFKSKKAIILGNNETSEVLYRSICEYSKIKEDKIHVSFVGHYSKDAKWNLFAKDVRYVSRGTTQGVKKYLGDWVLNKFYKKCLKNKGNKIQIFINFNNDKENIDYCSFLSEYINKIMEKTQDKKLLNKILSKIEVFAYYSTKYMSSYDNYVEKLKGCLRLIRKENVIANDFINKYPVALYATDKQIDFNTSCLKDGVKININFLGFGESSQQLFMSLFSNTQFVKRDKDGKVVVEPATFHIYDSKITDDNKLYNTTFKRYFNLFDNYDMSQPKPVSLHKDKEGNEYFDFPTLNLIERNFGDKGNIDKIEVKEKFYKDLENKDSKNINYIIISLSNDFESIDIANRIWKQIKSNPKKYKNVYIFIKVDNTDSASSIVDAINDENICLYDFSNADENKHKAILTNNVKFAKEACVETNKYEFLAKRTIYGSFKETSYNYEKIINAEIQKLGILQGQIYKALVDDNNKEQVLSLKKDEKIIEADLSDWTQTDEYGRQSNISAALNLRTKLLLMGLDYARGVAPKFDQYIKYWEYLDANDKPKLAIDKEISNKFGINGVDYLSFDYRETIDVSKIKISSRRWLLANVEHSRWNHNAICSGLTPMPKEVVRFIKKHKAIESGYNSCIASVDGLLDLKAFITELGSHKCDNIINFDYNQFDAAWHMLKVIDYEIIDKPNKASPFLN